MKEGKGEEFVSYRDYLPRLSIEERDRRWAAVWEEMTLNNLDCLLVVGDDRAFGQGDANPRYLTQLSGQGMGTVVIFPLEGTPVAFASPPHMHDKPFSVYKAFNDWVTETRPLAGLKPIIQTLKDMGYERSTIGLVGFKSAGPYASNTISREQYQLLKEELPRVSFIEATAILDKIRTIKSLEEIEMLKKSGEISRLKIEAMVRMAQPGIRECELFAEMVKTDISHGGEAYVFNLLTSGSVTDRGQTQHLLHGRGQPLSPTTRPLKKGDLIMTEFHTNYGGYLTGAEKSVFIGKPPRELQRLHDIAAECLEAGIEKLRPGVLVGEAAEAFRAPARKANIEFIELGFHGHGLSSPEFPRAATYPSDRLQVGKGAGPFFGLGSAVIKENMVVATNVDIHDPQWRKDVGIMGPSDTIWVTKKGPVKLVGTPTEFALVSV
jgi:Xaa-Pro aminopeptidase